jgi:hypothetical protein
MYAKLYLRRRSDRYRMERPVIRAGISPAEDPSLFTTHCYRNPVTTNRAMSRVPDWRGVRR